MIHEKASPRMNMSNKLESVENAILDLLADNKAMSIHELVKELGEKGHPESQVRGAVWALLSAHEIDVSKDYSLRRTALCA
jgi:predicted DNA-binding ribbon-helix-helix protein